MDAAKEDVEYWQESLKEFYQQFEKYGGGKGNGMEEDFKELVRWKQDFDAFMRGVLHDWDVCKREWDQGTAGRGREVVLSGSGWTGCRETLMR